MPTHPRVTATVIRPMPADRGVALVLFLALLVVGVLTSWDAPEAYSQGTHRHGRRAAVQGAASGRSDGLRAGPPPGGTYAAVAAAVKPGVATGHGEHDRPPFQALHAARRVDWQLDAGPAHGVPAGRPAVALSDPGYPAPSDRAPPVA